MHCHRLLGSGILPGFYLSDVQTLDSSPHLLCLLGHPEAHGGTCSQILQLTALWVLCHPCPPPDLACLFFSIARCHFSEILKQIRNKVVFHLPYKTQQALISPGLTLLTNLYKTCIHFMQNFQTRVLPVVCSVLTVLSLIPVYFPRSYTVTINGI